MTGKYRPAAARILLAAFLLAAGPAAGSREPAGSTVDILFVNGRIMDGSGNPGYSGDIAVNSGRIAAIGKLAGKISARRIVDIGGLVICPGFIDQHSHAYDGVAGPEVWSGPDEIRFAAPNFVSQGVTTVVSNLCGYGPESLGPQIEALEKKRTGPNAALMIGHNAIRQAVMKNDFRRSASDDEVRRMAALVREAMAAGAFGLSSGLEYVPSIWSTPEEIAALVREIVPYGGVYMAHERASGLSPMWYIPSRDPAGPPNMIDNIRELIEIGRTTGARVVASHIKARGADFWGASRILIRLINDARARGVDVWADCYPYTTSGSDGSAVLLPPWAQSRNGERLFQKPDAGSKTARDLALDFRAAINWRGGPENIVVMEYPDKAFVGRTLAELAAAHGLSAVEMVLKMAREGDRGLPGGARFRGYSLWEEDIDAFYSQPWTATASDAVVALPSDGPGSHARFYGTFPRRIRRYAMERNVSTVEDAVRSMTSLPALILGLDDRGQIKEGFRADLVVFDQAKIRDAATFAEPYRPSEGIEFVVVNGTFVLEKGRLTGARPGVLLRKGVRIP